MIHPPGLKCLPQLVSDNFATMNDKNNASGLIEAGKHFYQHSPLICQGQVTFNTCTTYSSLENTIFHEKEFYSQALEIIWTKKTNFVTKNMNGSSRGLMERYLQYIFKFANSSQNFLPNQNNNSLCSHNTFEYNFTFLINYTCNFQNIIQSITNQEKYFHIE